MYLTWIGSFDPPKNTETQSYPHFQDKETEVLRGYVTGPRGHDQQNAELRVKPKLSGFRVFEKLEQLKCTQGNSKDTSGGMRFEEWVSIRGMADPEGMRKMGRAFQQEEKGHAKAQRVEQAH